VVEFPSLATVEQQHIEAALAHFGGNRTRTSVALGISKATLWRKLKAYAKRADAEAVTYEEETISTERRG
jgi:DNA-binding NtrC family response regulator